MSEIVAATAGDTAAAANAAPMEADLIVQFLRRVEATSSPDTHRGYRSALRSWWRFLDLEGVRLLAAREAQVVTYVNRLRREGKGAATVAQHLCKVRRLYEWLHRSGHIARNPCDDVQIRVEERPGRAVDASLVMAVIDSITGRDPESLRDRALLEVMLAGGSRISETLAADISDILWQQKAIYLSARKGGGTGTIMLTDRAIAALRDYLENGRPFYYQAEPTRALFVSRKGHRLSRAAAYRAFVSRSRAVGVRLTPHDARRALGIGLIERGVPTRIVQKILGHRRLSSTERYTEVSMRSVREFYDRAHPRLQAQPEPAGAAAGDGGKQRVTASTPMR